MAEYRFFDGDVPYVSTAEFHANRERAPHLEQAEHQARLFAAAFLLASYGEGNFVDLACGDGGLLSLVQAHFFAAWGYDFQPSNQLGWVERGVQARLLDVFGADRHEVELGETAALTEVLEHLADPHGELRWLRESGVGRLVCSSPAFETPTAHSDLHAWGWDADGYQEMLEGAGWQIRRRFIVGPFQVVCAL